MIKPERASEPQPYGSAYGRWFMANVRREIAAGRLRQTSDGQSPLIRLAAIRDRL